LSTKHISVSIATANYFFAFFCKRKFLPLCKAISNSEKILLENTLNACALIYYGVLSFWVCKVSWNQISQYFLELFLELLILNLNKKKLSKKIVKKIRQKVRQKFRQKNLSKILVKKIRQKSSSKNLSKTSP
jgi:hypothetical protein